LPGRLNYGLGVHRLVVPHLPYAEALGVDDLAVVDHHGGHARHLRRFLVLPGELIELCDGVGDPARGDRYVGDLTGRRLGGRPPTDPPTPGRRRLTWTRWWSWRSPSGVRSRRGRPHLPRLPRRRRHPGTVDGSAPVTVPNEPPRSPTMRLSGRALHAVSLTIMRADNPETGVASEAGRGCLRSSPNARSGQVSGETVHELLVP